MNDAAEKPAGQVGTAVAPAAPYRTRDVAVGVQGIQFSNAADVMMYARMMADSGFAVRKEFRENPGACLAIVDDAMRWGLSAYFLARRAYLVNDMLAYESSVFASVIIERGPLAKLPKYTYEGEGPDRVCIVTLYTKPGMAEGDVIEHRSPKFKDIQPKNSPLWKTDPDQQQGYYTIRAAARRNFPNVLGGAVDFEEAAAAQAKDVTPRSTLHERLQNGGAEGFSREAIDEELSNGTAEAVAPASEEAPPEAEKVALSADESAMLADIGTQLRAAASNREIDVIENDFAGVREAARIDGKAPLAEQVAALIHARRAELSTPGAAKPKRKAKTDKPETLV